MRLALRFFATARRNGAEILTFTDVTGVTLAGPSVRGVAVRDHAAGRDYEIGADLVVNAAGAWAGKVAAMAGVTVPIELSAGILVAVRGRHCNMVVNRLHAPADGDVALPQRQMTVLGTSSRPVREPDDPGVPADHVEAVVSEASRLLPALRGAQIRAAWPAVRPLVGDSGAVDGPGLDRESHCFDHALDATPIEGFVTIAGGMTTTLRATAEVAANVVCGKLGLDRACQTAEVTLLPHTAWYSR
jgi:glycerol-3-phosphate dehydrogenase